MPECKRCHKVAASAEMRRSPDKQTWVCKDKLPCKSRRRGK